MVRGEIFLIRTAAAMAAVVLLVLLSIPAPQMVFEVDVDEARPDVVKGAFHVHTSRSGGSGSVEEVAGAAARAGLAFVIFTDHGDGTRTPVAPRYQAGVLCLDGVEISTTDGHYIAIDMPAAPYPLGGESRDVAEDVSRLGGFGVIAHPTSAKPALRWRDWTVVSDGIEWLSADSEWRDEALFRLAAVLAHYPVRPAQTLASLLDRPERALLRWDGLTQRRRVVGLTGLDAHGAVALPGGNDYRLALLKVPSYEQAFRSFAIRAELESAWTGDALEDAVTLIDAVRAGRVYTAIDAVAAPGRFHFTARSGRTVARMGDVLPVAEGIELQVQASMPANGEIRLYENGAVVRRTSNPELRYRAGTRAAVFRAEVMLAGAPGSPPVPWILGNPIYIGLDEEQGSAVGGGERNLHTRALFTDEETAAAWSVEHDSESLAAVDSTASVEGRELAFRYALSGGAEADLFAGLVRQDIGSLRTYDRVTLRARSDRPQRMSVQLRVQGPGEGERWHRSVYVDEEVRNVTVRFRDMRPIGLRPAPQPDLDGVQALLFVVDRVNTAPATAGVIWLDDIRLEGPAASVLP